MSAIDLMNTLLGQFASFTMEAGVLYGTVGVGGVPLTQPGGVYVDGVYIPPGLDFSGFMAEGGLVNSASLAVIGEAGAEAVIPLTDPARAMELMQATGLDSLAMSGMRFGSSGGSTSITVNVAGSVISQNDLIESIRRGLSNSQRNGNQLVYSL